MTQLSNSSKNHERLTAIVNRAIFVGFYTPFVSWAWHKIIGPVELVPIALKQVIYENRTISSLVLLLGILCYLIILNIYYMWLLNKWRKDFFALYKEEATNFKNSPLRTSLALLKVTFMAVLFGGSAFLASQFVILR